jgi:hypothetical protein
MQRIRMAGLALVAVFAIGAIASASASAALPEFKPVPTKFTFTSGKSVLEQKGGLSPIECAKDESAGTNEITTEKKGKFDVLFLECKVALTGEQCTGLNDTTAGSILALGEFHLFYINKETKDVGQALLLQEVHFECAGPFVKLVAVRGCVVGLITPINTKTTKFTLTLAQKGGVNEFTTFEKESCKLESSINGGAFTQSGQSTTESILTEKEAEIKA